MRAPTDEYPDINALLLKCKVNIYEDTRGRWYWNVIFPHHWGQGDFNPQVDSGTGRYWLSGSCAFQNEAMQTAYTTLGTILGEWMYNWAKSYVPHTVAVSSLLTMGE